MRTTYMVDYHTMIELMDQAYKRGYADGVPAGSVQGYETGRADNDEAEEAAYNEGFEHGEAQGYDAGYNEGVADGYDEGYEQGYDAGLDEYALADAAFRVEKAIRAAEKAAYEDQKPVLWVEGWGKFK
jgi:flagellar biosynthesis/type III secretory pathway protein FliH